MREILCPRCGYNIPVDRESCPNCGEFISADIFTNREGETPTILVQDEDEVGKLESESKTKSDNSITSTLESVTQAGKSPSDLPRIMDATRVAIPKRGKIGVSAGRMRSWACCITLIIGSMFLLIFPAVLFSDGENTKEPTNIISTHVAIFTPTKQGVELPTFTSTSRPSPVPILSLFPATATPFSKEPIGKIVYTCQIFKDENRNQICITNSDGTGYKRLTDKDQANYWYASWAPDGKSIVLSSNQTGRHEIYEIDLQGKQKRLTDIGELFAPEISPDGHYIVFVNALSTFSAILIMNLDCSNPYLLYS
jgi:hypothetical protein